MEAWTATKQAEGIWLFEWTAGSGESFDIWLDGKLLDTATDDEYECEEPGYDDEPPPLEIVPAADDAENDLHRPYIVLQWREVSGAYGYVVEKNVSGSWIAQETISDSDAGYYFYETTTLDDDTQYQYRVKAVDANGNAGDSVTFTFTVCRNPEPPEVDISIDGSNDILVEEAS